MENVYSKFNFPKETNVDKEIPIEKFLRDDCIDDDYKEIFRMYTNKITLKYCLKNNVLGLESIETDEYEFSEIEVIEIDINNNLAIYDIATVIGRTIQYPTLLVFIKDNKFKLGVYKVRKNKIEDYKNVVEDICFSGWFSKEELYGRINKIIKKMALIKDTYKDMFDLYSNYYKIIDENKAAYIQLDELSKLLSKVEGINRKRKRIVAYCECVPVYNEENNKIAIFNSNKLTKYNLSIDGTSKVCIDDYLYYTYKYCEKHFKDYDTFIKLINKIKKHNAIKESVKKSLTRSKYDCIFFDGKSCVYDTYEKNCNNPLLCENFKKNKENGEKKRDRISINLISEKIVLEERNNNLDEVGYGDTIFLLNCEDNTIKKYKAIRYGENDMPLIPKMCLNKKINDEIFIKDKKYKIISIQKE